MVKLNCFMYDWSYRDEEYTDDNNNDCLKTLIRGYGITEKQESVYLQIEHYTPYLRIEMPTVIDGKDFKWDEMNIKYVYNKFMSLCRRQDFKPIKYKLEYKRKLYFAHKTKLNGKYYDKFFPYLLLVFNSLKALSSFTWILKKPIDILNVGMNITFKFHESDSTANPILKMTSIRKIPSSGWISVIGKEIKHSKESTFREIACDFKNLNPVNINTVPLPLILCFDCEMNSKNITAMPNSQLKEDVVFQIGCIISRNIGYDKEKNKYRKILLTTGNTYRFPIFSKKTNNIINKYLNDKDSFEIRCFKNETKLLLGFTDLINEINPNIITGYNIFGFDIEYLYERAKYNGIEKEFLNFSCIPKIPSYVYDKDKWESKAYGKQNIVRIVSEGRLFIDILPFIQRNYKLVNYKLDTVAKYFKVGAKDPLKPKDIFKCYRDSTKESLFKCAIYCIQDSLVTLYVFEIIYMWVSLTEEAKTNNVPIVVLYTKGQQIKMFSQVYNYCMYHNYVVESDAYEAKSDEHYTGALVLEPKKGKYKLIASLDFASLYPSIMIAKNIDYSTCVRDDDVSDEDCHVFSWDEHVNCIHDKKYVEKEEKKQERKEKIAKNKIIKEQKEKEKNNKKLFQLEAKRINNTLNDEEKSFMELLSETDDDLKMIEKKRIKKLDPNYIKEKENKKEIKDALSTVKLNLDGKQGEEHSPALKKVCGSFKYKFIKAEVSEKGVIPTLLENLLSARKETRKQLKEVENKIKELEKDNKDNNEIEQLKNLAIVLNKRQLSYKVSANSMYGAMGVKKGYLPFLPGAMCVTFVGRQSIAKTVKIVEEKYNGNVIYGDSVVKDTPILCKINIDYKFNKDISIIINKYNNFIIYKSIDEIGNEIENNEWKTYHGPKEYRYTNLMVWSDKGFTKINKVIRHITNKKIFRILTSSGVVDVTEDHSLLNSNKEKISPKDVKIGTELLTHDLPKGDIIFRENTINNKIYMAELYYHCCTYNNNTILFEPHKHIPPPDDTILIDAGPNNKKDKNKVENIYEIKGYSDYVYDLETENHHFSAGIGKLIVHNTDSVMVKFQESDIKKICEIARDISRYSQEVFPSPMKLEFEGKLYYIYLLFSKKRYALIECDENGKIDPDIKSKGIVLQRRDNSKFLKQLYKSTIQFIFDDKTLYNVLDNINDYINKLFSRGYSYKDFTITKSLTRDDYKKKPAHALLAEKMKKRGLNVPVGSKISYIITTQGGNNYKSKQTDKIVDEDYFEEWREILRVDFLYLLEKQALNPLNEILETTYPEFQNREVSYMKSQYLLRKQKELITKQIASFSQPKLKFVNSDNKIENEIKLITKKRNKLIDLI